jgi:hypothetical protein
MDDMTVFEDRLEERLRAFAGTGVKSVNSAAVARAMAARHPRSAATRPAVRRLGGENRRPRLRAVIGSSRTRSLVRTSLVAAAAVAVFVSGAMLLTRPDQPSIGAPSPTPTAGPSQSEAAAGPSASPSPIPTPLLWTQASLEEDWPAPVRLEPAGGAAIVHSLEIDLNGPPVTYPDPAGDVDASVPWIDIRELWISGSRTTLTMRLAVNVAPVVDPTEQWIAYGVVWDTDRDGVPDLRFGGDNPEPTDGRRVWITELHSGRTVVNPGGGYFHETFYDKFFEVFLPSENCSGARLKFGGDTTGTGPNGGGIVGGMHSPFYAWASVIQDGRVVATDYAPDVGWLDPSAKAKP